MTASEARPVLTGAAALGAAVLALSAPAARAGPPFATDDPQPTDLRHWETYLFATGAHVDGETSGEGGLDINYGAAPDLQLTLVLPAAFEASDRTRVGFGGVEVAAKYKLLHQATGSAMPDVAVFPRLFLPTESRGFGTGRLGVLLPVWAQKDFGRWSVFGGGGYQINPGPGNRNFWAGGLVVTRQVGERTSMGVEVYHRTPDADDGVDFTGVNLGLSYRMTEHWSVLASGGPGLQGAASGGRYAFYLALKADY